MMSELSRRMMKGRVWRELAGISRGIGGRLPGPIGAPSATWTIVGVAVPAPSPRFACPLSFARGLSGSNAELYSAEPFRRIGVQSTIAVARVFAGVGNLNL
jgi:hypothetical protein